MDSTNMQSNESNPPMYGPEIECHEVCLDTIEGESDHPTWMQRLWKRKWFVLSMWQVCSLLITAMNVAATELIILAGQSLPFLELLAAYGMLSLCHSWKIPRTPTSSPWWNFTIVGVLNYMGDGLNVLALDYTSMSSAMLLVTTAIFWVVPASCWILKSKFSIWQIISLFLGAGGIICVFLADRTDDQSKWLGNLLAIGSAMAAAGATVFEELLLRNVSTDCYVSRFSLPAAILSGIVCGSYEWRTIRDFPFTWKAILLIVTYGTTQTVYYTIDPYIMQHSSAAEMNLSFLTTTFFSLLISVLFYGQRASWLYLLGFLCIPSAIAMFSLLPLKEKREESLSEHR
jgi:drug/metabolite transporter (DMT)-like permease